jgi:Legionella pneumophila major outer membrane protein precursor
MRIRATTHFIIVTALACLAASTAAAQSARFDRNPITRWASTQDGSTMQSPAVPGTYMEPNREELSYVPAESIPAYTLPQSAPSSGCADCESQAPCDTCETPCVQRRWRGWDAGFAFTFLEPRSSNNLAITTTENATQSASITETSFDYDVELSPRIWLKWGSAESLGWRVQWWQLDQDANQIVAAAPENGLGVVAPVAFPDVDISISLPGESLQADNHLKLYTVDLEGTRRVDFDCWSLLAAGGLRFAKIDEQYRAVSTNADGVISGSIEQNRSLDGFGPTFFLEARRPATCRLTVFSNVRASLLFGDGDTTLLAGEDLDLASAFTTARTAQTDSLLPILESQLGLEWCAPVTRCHDFFVNAALEGQWWGGVGTAANDDADLGLFGFALGLGLQY